MEEQKPIPFTPTPGQKAAFTKHFNEFKEEVTKDLQDIKDSVEEIKKFDAAYIKGDAANPSIKNKIDLLHIQFINKVNDATTRYDSIIKLHDELFEGTATTDPISDQLNELVSESEKKVLEIESKKKDVEKFYDDVFGTEISGKIVTEGYKHKLDKRVKDIAEFLKVENGKYKALFDQILSLLPGATSIGLAKAFEDQKNSYRKPLRNWGNVFVATMVAMVTFGIVYIIEISSVDNLDVSKAFIAIINKLPFFVPAIWLAIFSSRQQSQYKRLQQEYAFKETFAKSYDGQKTQLEKLDVSDEDSNQILKNLLENLVLITSHNPSSTLESEKHEEKVPIVDNFKTLLALKRNKSAEE